MANFDVAKAIFAQADTNNDGRIDRNEFQNWASGGFTGASTGGITSSTYESSLQTNTVGIDAAQILAASGSAGIAGQSSASGYEASYSSHSGIETASGGQLNGNATASASSIEFAQGGSAALESSSVQQTAQFTSAAGLFNDPNPQIIRRAATSGAVTYQQKILVRFLQPPAVPPPGPLIIKEVRPPQPPPPPPLVVRQRAPPAPQPPPLILRERPPPVPATVASQTVVRHLAAIPVPPRSVIIERLPALPPKPRDIIIERWVPYGAMAKRRTIVQRAAAAKEYPKPRNIIIQYEAPQVRIVRQFERLGVTQENPQAYVARYGASLLDASTLVQQARAAGVVEDISPPAGAASLSTQFTASASSAEAGFNYSSSSTREAAGFGGLQIAGDAGASASGIELASGGATDLAATGGSYSSESFSTTSGSYGIEGITTASVDPIAATFAAADTNKDGTLDANEFRRFVQGGL
ncbi:unnamed protein product [Adineta ricciae]|uniref:EF-hand domain-containing protein n=1 Tax=Adineta ricciae TaxID=249248 RepID=A0A815QKB8_ADIRI|nr:unnamed protein product [Adineta ricciae]